jgi:hypothetical protein|tara:strand:- start:68 stop:556 length:489 start_codon:yes stop_codon:yes gene_type:complete
MRSDLLNSNSGKYSLQDSGAVRCLKQTVEFTASSASIASGAINIPEDAVITKLIAVVHTALAYATATVGVKAGSAAAGAQFMALDADGLVGSTTSLAAGKGVSTFDEYTTALGGAAAQDLVADSAKVAGGTDVHFTTVASTGAFTAGKMTYIVEYIPLKDNV